MTGFRRICCPVDFSEPSRLALQEAAQLARREGASLTVLHVRELPVQDLGGPLAPPPMVATEAVPHQLEGWRADAERIRGAPVDSVLLGPPVAPAIAEFARDTGVDLVVIASHGRTGLSRLVMGSVAELVVRSAPCPVLVYRAPAFHRYEVNDLSVTVPP